MWVIIPKDINEAADQWGVPSKAIGRLLFQDEETLEWITIMPETTPVRDGVDFKVLILCPPVRGRPFQGLPEWYNFGSVCGVFVHFGTGELVDFSMDKISKDWANTVNKYSLKDFGPEQWPVMPITTGGWPWMDEIKKFQDNLEEKTSVEHLDSLKEAWVKANAYINLEHPVQATLEALYPLYLDLSNHQIEPLGSDFSYALASSAKNLAAALSDMGYSKIKQPLGLALPKGCTFDKAYPRIGQLQKTLERMKDNAVEKKKELIEASISLLSIIEYLESHGAEDEIVACFIRKYVDLSKTYTGYLVSEKQVVAPIL